MSERKVTEGRRKMARIAEIDRALAQMKHTEAELLAERSELFAEVSAAIEVPTDGELESLDEVLESARGLLRMVLKEHKDDEPRGFVYFIRSTESGCVKIGTARDPKERMCDLQIGNHERLTLAAIMPGDSRMERDLHQVLSKSRVSGEWFRGTESVFALVHAVREEFWRIQP